ncbi:MAG: PKD domain-containing protein [Thermoleophilaceae bacterium]
MDGCTVCGSFEERSGAALLAGLICPEPANTVPTARFTVEPNPVQSGQTVTLDASASSDPEGRIVRYEWDLDSTIVSEPSGLPSQFEIDARGEPTIRRVVRTSLVGGTEVRTIGLRVTDGRGARHVQTGTLRIVGPPQPSPGASAPTARFSVSPNPGFVGESVHFDGSASSDPNGDELSFEWDFEGGGSFTSTGTDPTTLHIYDTPGTRDVRLRVTDPSGLSGESTVSVTINPSGLASGLASAARLPARSAPAHASRRARRGSRFSARLRGRALRGRAGTLARRGGRVVLRGVVARGRLRGKLRGRPPAGPSLRGFLSSRWIGRLSASVRPARRTVRVRVTALAGFRGRRGRACLRIALSSRRGRPLSGKFRLAGGTAAAARISAAGRVVYRPARGTLRGRIRARKAAPRPLPPACRRLARLARR